MTEEKKASASMSKKNNPVIPSWAWWFGAAIFISSFVGAFLFSPISLTPRSTFMPASISPDVRSMPGRAVMGSSEQPMELDKCNKKCRAAFVTYYQALGENMYPIVEVNK